MKKISRGFQFYLSSQINLENLKEYLASISSFSFSEIFSSKKHLIFKETLSSDIIALPELSPKSHPYATLISGRKSERNFRKQTFRIDSIARILRTSLSKTQTENGNLTAPSVGGLCSTEIYFVNLSVSDIPKGLYHYNVEKFSLEVISNFEMFDSKKYFVDENIDFENAAGLFIFTVKPALIEQKYTFRAWRLLLIETGHIMMNLWLSVLNENLVGTSLGGGFDSNIHEFLEVDGCTECYIAAFIMGSI